MSIVPLNKEKVFIGDINKQKYAIKSESGTNLAQQIFYCLPEYNHIYKARRSYNGP